MMKSGMNVVEAAEVLYGYIGDSKFKKITAQIKLCLSKGDTLSSALAKFPHVFPDWQVSIIKYSETAGKLAQGLEKINLYIENEYKTQKRLILGLVYPVILFHIAVFFLPIPQLVRAGVITYFLEVVKVIVPVYGVFFLIFILRQAFYSTKGYHGFILSFPVLGKLVKQVNLIRFVLALKSLYSSGVNVLQSWKIATGLCENSVMKKSLSRGFPIIEKGGELSRAFIKTGLFPRRTVGMIVSGEKSGSIDKMLEKIIQYTESENQMITGVLLTVIPVIVYLGVAAYIGYRVISFYLGYFSKVFSF